MAAKCLHTLIVSDYNRQLFMREMSIAARVAKSGPGGPVLVAKSEPENIMSLLPSVLLRVHSTSTKCNNANGNKAVIFSGIACHYGDHDFS